MQSLTKVNSLNHSLHFDWITLARVSVRLLETSMKKLQEENSQLKSKNQALTEQNNALQTALVICTKAIPKELTFVEKVCCILEFRNF